MSLYFFIAAALPALYIGLSLAAYWAAHKLPRRPVDDPPDWGTVTDTFIPARDGGRLEVWRVAPDLKEGETPAGVVLLAHGWGRNRGRMTPRARMFGQWGYVTVYHSARDHGNSSPLPYTNAFRLAEDIEAVMDWVGEPVILYGHSAGSAAAIVAAGRNPGRIRLLFLEAAYHRTRTALLSLYRWVNPVFGILFGPAIVFQMNLYYRRTFGKNALGQADPVKQAKRIGCPVMLIHGEQDRRFPVAFARELYAAFRAGQATLFVAPGARHSDSSEKPGYKEAVRAFLKANDPGFRER